MTWAKIAVLLIGIAAIVYGPGIVQRARDEHALAMAEAQYNAQRMTDAEYDASKKAKSDECAAKYAAKVNAGLECWAYLRELGLVP